MFVGTIVLPFVFKIVYKRTSYFFDKGKLDPFLGLFLDKRDCITFPINITELEIDNIRPSESKNCT